MANGHGGKRVGAGRPRKSLSDKIYEGTDKKHKPKVLDIPSVDDIPAPEAPDFLRHMTARGIDDSVPNMEWVFNETVKFLEQTKCLHLISPLLISKFAMHTTRWLKHEDVVQRCIMVKDKHGNLIANPLSDQALKYSKAADLVWMQIWDIVNQNSTSYFGDNPQEEMMAFIIRNKPSGKL